MRIGILKSMNSPLVAMVPPLANKLISEGHEIRIEKGAGEQSFYDDEAYQAAGVSVASRSGILKDSEIILTDTSLHNGDLKDLSKDACLIGRFNPRIPSKLTQDLQQWDGYAFSLDMVPRITIAQSMDVLSSLASLSGYKAVITAAENFPGYFPMMTTAAGTVPPAKVLVLGAGVAGLQAIATARRLGAVVEAFDVRSAVKEEVRSLGAKFIEVDGGKEDTGAGGYAVTQSEEFAQRQRELIHERAVQSDIIITTASIPGKKAPLLVQKQTVEGMRPGSVIVDLAAASGGNCELSEDQKEKMINGVTVIGNSSLFNTLPREASRLYSSNLIHFIKFIFKDGKEKIDWDHAIVKDTLMKSLVAQ